MKNFLVIIVSLFLTLALCEVVFRMLESSNSILPGGYGSKAPKEYMKIHSAKRVRSSNRLLVSELDKRDPRVNSIGIRDREFSLAKPRDVFRMVAIGDSVTFGLGVPAEKSFPKVIEQQLILKGTKTEVMNFGISSYDTIAELELYKTSASKFNPDVVILTYILNDTMRPGQSTEKTLFGNDHHKTTTKDILISYSTKTLEYLSGFSHFFKWINFLVQKITSGFISEQIYHATYTNNTTWNPTRQAIHNFASESKHNNQKLVVVVLPLLIDFKNYTYTAEHKMVVDEFSGLGVPVLDMLDKFSNEEYTDFTLNNEDSTHPNEYGHQFIANHIVHFMEKNRLLPHAIRNTDLPH